MRGMDETEVLVVGGGPVGMLTALVLAKEGIQPTIIDKEQRTATRSYACVLHPATLELLARLGLVEEVQARGWPIETVAFYDGRSRCAEIKFSELSGNFRHALTLPQSALEEVLERRLRETNTTVLWNHRLTDLEFGDEPVIAHIDKLKQSAKGYGVADWDWTVQKNLQTAAAFVVGADGHDSTVRSRLGIDYTLLAGPEQFAVFEFDTDGDLGTEARVVINDATTNVLWPLPGGRCRWTFQLVKTAAAGEFPAKDRETLRYVRDEVNEQLKASVERLAASRAPWFAGGVKNIQWSGRIRFEHRLAKEFGKNRTWLVGDAAHQTGPVGVQSMNGGLLEAETLAQTLKKILRDGSPRRILQEYGHLHQTQWGQLLGQDGAAAGSSANPWVRSRAGRILPCVPAFGEHLAQAMGQLGLEIEAPGIPS